MVRRFLLPAFAVAAVLLLAANSAEAKLFNKASRAPGNACEAYAGDAPAPDCGCGGASSCCDDCCAPKCGHRLRDLFHRCCDACKPACCEPACCEPAPCCKPKRCCKPKCCKPKCCEPVCCDPCNDCCCRPTPIRDLLAGLRDALHSCCCDSCCDDCGCGAPAASCGCGH